jgi:hypothetical protein
MGVRSGAPNRREAGSPSKWSTSPWLVALPERVDPVTQVRGALIVASREQLKAIGYFDAYVAGLSPESHAALDELIAASWVPIELAHAHFQAIERLGIDTATVEANTRAVATRLQGIFLSTVVKAARGSGATPLSAVRVLRVLWGRVFTGGAIGVKQTGPKEGVIVVSGNPLLAYRYHRTGVRMHVASAAELFSTRAYVREHSYKADTYELALRVQWV